MKKAKTIWIKYRTCWAWGYGQWYYHFVDYIENTRKNSSDMKAMIEELAHNDNGSDKYRGIEWLKVKHPPKEYMLEQLKQKKRSIQYALDGYKEFKKEFSRHFGRLKKKE
jgi:hypothetical protein